MPTPSIQTLVTDAQQVLNLDSISAVRSVVAVALANANTGTPLNPNLTTQQLWNEFYQVVTKPKSDIESIIANQLMKFLFAPPAPGGAGANKQVIFNDGGVLAGDPQFLWDKTTNLLTVTGSATITGDLTVDTNVLKVDTLNNRVGIGTASPAAGYTLDVVGSSRITGPGVTLTLDKTGAAALQLNASGNAGAQLSTSGVGGLLVYTANGIGGAMDVRHQIASDGVATWSNVGGVAGTAMTLNATGLGVGASPAERLTIGSSTAANYIKLTNTGATNGFLIGCFNTTVDIRNKEAGAMNFFTSDTQRMQIDSSGNVGIGVTPSALLHVQKSQNSETTAIINNTNTGTSAGVRLDLQSNSSNYLTLQSFGQNYSGNAFGIAAAKLNVVSENAATAFSSGLAIGTTSSNPLYFATSNTVKMTLNASGNLLVGTTSSPLASRVSVGVTNAQPDAFVIRNSDATAGLYWRLAYVNSSNTFHILNQGGVGVYLTDGATSWTGTSDERLKDIIEPISNAVAKVGSLRSVIGKFKTDSEGTRRSFLIAQDVQAVLPEAVDTTNADAFGVRYSEVIPLLVAAIKELTARVQTLETR